MLWKGVLIYLCEETQINIMFNNRIMLKGAFNVMYFLTLQIILYPYSQILKNLSLALAGSYPHFMFNLKMAKPSKNIVKKAR